MVDEIVRRIQDEDAADARLRQQKQEVRRGPGAGGGMWGASSGAL